MSDGAGMVVERFAPSPTGRLHLGHAYSALIAFRAARAAGGQFLLRMDDLDPARTRQEFIDGVYEDMRWLGLDWDGAVYVTSRHTIAHQKALQRLHDLGVIYACQCTRKDIQMAVSAPQENTDQPPLYPGTCRGKDIPHSQPNVALRMDMARAIGVLGGAAAVNELSFSERDAGPNGETGQIHLNTDRLLSEVGDVVLHRKDGSIAYHLAVVIDDDIQGVTCVTRGRDLFDSTPIHRLLQALLGLRVPQYRHHRLIRDDLGRRLAKRDGDRSIASFRDAGLTPQDIWALLDSHK